LAETPPLPQQLAQQQGAYKDKEIFQKSPGSSKAEGVSNNPLFLRFFLRA
jgi:hypothetical protein